MVGDRQEVVVPVAVRLDDFSGRKQAIGRRAVTVDISTIILARLIERKITHA
jgi:hypothetical protein